MFGLESMNLDSSNYNGGSLKELLKLVYPFTDGVSKPARKADIIKLLHAFYSDSESAQRLYDRLSKYEKALLCCTVQSNYKPLREDFAELAKAHKFEPEKQRNYYYYSSSSMSKSTYYPKNGLLGAFYVNGSIPPCLRHILMQSLRCMCGILYPARLMKTNMPPSLAERTGTKTSMLLCAL